MATYRIGCCVPGGLLSKEHGEDALTRLRYGCDYVLARGFDYAEVGVGSLLELSEEELAAAATDRLPIEACNCFVPAAMPIIGQRFLKGEPLYRHAEEVMRRMSLLGIEILVFGSGPARRVPADGDIDAGREELRRFLAMCAALGEQYGVTLVIEPLNPHECNVINTPQAALDMAAAVNSPRVAYLADAYHMAGSDVAPDALDHVAVLPRHIHVAEPPKRTCPGSTGGEYLKAFAASLHRTDYAARVSVECDFRDVADEMPKVKAFLDEWF